MNCSLCGLSCTRGFWLTNGTVIHNDCIERSLEQQSLLQRRADAIRSGITRERELLAAESSLWASISRWLRSSGSKDSYHQESIAQCERELAQIYDTVTDMKKAIEQLYDYWPTYPPDWDNRSLQIRSASGGRCEDCRRRPRILHVHHRKPLSEGGSNQLGNLEALCEGCHGKRHGGRDLKSERRHSRIEGKSEFIKRLELLQRAIENSQRVSFWYRKRDGERMRRTIWPKRIVKVGNSTCISGFCMLRREDRTFSIQRISKLSIE